MEFERVANFSDAVFAIALTLLVLSVEVPEVKDTELTGAIRDLRPQIQSFAIGFVVIGFYWLGHHGFFRLLKAVDAPLMMLNLAYLGAIAFIPFPTALVGEYSEQPVAVVLYAATLGAASLLDGLMFVLAYRHDLFREPMSRATFRWSVRAALAPVVVFLISIPIAYVDPGLALLSWLLIIPAERLIHARRPAEAEGSGYQA